MNLTTQINKDIKNAMLAKEKGKLAALRAIKAALLLEATKEGGNNEILESTELSILQKLYKQRVDATKIYIEQNREDLAKEEEFQANVIKEYLPKQLNEDEISNIIKGIISNIGANSPSDMGKVMGIAMGKLKGKADGGIISKIVKQQLK